MRVKALVMFALTLLLATTARASTETLLYSFNSFSGDGYYPYSGLVADSKGNLYGTTQNGGAGYGTVFELKLSGGTYTEIQLHSFTAGANDGAYPEYSTLIFDKAGNLYGTTYQGGAANVGTIFELSPAGGDQWTETLIHSFAGYPKDGGYPQAGLSIDSTGAIFGTTEYGGGHNQGSVFQLKPSGKKWTYKAIHSFVSGSNGGYEPVGGITQGLHGYYYGTAYYGGKTYNAGVVYRLFVARGKWVSQTVYVFSGGTLGTYPDSTLAMDAKGNFFGVTYQGGANNLGTVFELVMGKNDKYTYKVLYSFKGGNTDGQTPWYGAGVTLDAKGNLYGTTRYGGSTSNAGTVYELKLANGKYKEVILHAFVGGAGDGSQPLAGLALVKGKLVGTTYASGAHGAGTVFNVKP